VLSDAGVTIVQADAAGHLQSVAARYVDVQVYRALLESNAAFFADADDGDGYGSENWRI